MVTEKYSLKGWSLFELLKYNKDNLKVLVTFLAGYSYITGFSWPVFTMALVAILAKFCVDTIDYFFKE